MFQMISSLRKNWLQSYKLNQLRTFVYATFNPCTSPRVAFIFGCQRSGTTLLRNFIGLDARFRDIGEGDPPFFHHEKGDRYMRLVDDGEVEALVRRQKNPWVLLKPLHDSQQAVELLARFKGSRGIWIFRHYNSVVQSHLAYYRHNPLDYLQPLRQRDLDSWMLSGLHAERLARVCELLNLAESSIPDLYAVFWYARNALLFQHLQHTSLLVVSYEDLVAAPHQCLQAINRHLEMELSTKALTLPNRLVAKSGTSCMLKLDIKAACDEMLEELSSVSQLLGPQ